MIRYSKEAKEAGWRDVPSMAEYIRSVPPNGLLRHKTTALENRGKCMKKPKGLHRKETLMRMLSGMRGAFQQELTPGEQAALAIALKMIDKTSVEELDYWASLTPPAEPFWSECW